MSNIRLRVRELMDHYRHHYMATLKMLVRIELRERGFNIRKPYKLKVVSAQKYCLGSGLELWWAMNGRPEKVAVALKYDDEKEWNQLSPPVIMDDPYTLKSPLKM